MKTTNKTGILSPLIWQQRPFFEHPQGEIPSDSSQQQWSFSP
jgi:hypothetical protein